MSENGKIYNVCAPRAYKTRSGEARTHFWVVGTAFPLRERDGLSVKLYTRVLPTDELVLLVREPRAAGTGDSTTEPDPSDDIPF